jgi:uncharacterized protein
MTVTDKINIDIKAAMLARDKDKLEALRAVKAALLLASTEKGAEGEVSEDAEMKVLQKLVKQRKESAAIYNEQGRADLAGTELQQAEVIEAYLPEQMGEDEVRAIVQQIITQTGASTPADIGKVMGTAMKQLAGKADGKTISAIAKDILG